MTSLDTFAVLFLQSAGGPQAAAYNQTLNTISASEGVRANDTERMHEYCGLLDQQCFIYRMKAPRVPATNDIVTDERLFAQAYQCHDSAHILRVGSTTNAAYLDTFDRAAPTTQTFTLKKGFKNNRVRRIVIRDRLGIETNAVFELAETKDASPITHLTDLPVRFSAAHRLLAREHILIKSLGAAIDFLASENSVGLLANGLALGVVLSDNEENSGWYLSGLRDDNKVFDFGSLHLADIKGALDRFKKLLSR